jgi:pimeloyl-ACP methyl ester carboxylesterase
MILLPVVACVLGWPHSGFAQAPPKPAAGAAKPPTPPPVTAKPPTGKPANANTGPAAKPGVPGTVGAGQKPAAAGVGKPGGKKPEKPPMQTLDLPTADGIKLRAFYFPSEVGKGAVPVIVIHEWQGQASPYSALVRKLTDLGCAVIVPELRGHGASRQQQTPAGQRTLEVAKMSRPDVLAMVKFDLEAVKKFLVQENDAERLNLNALALIGVGEGAIVAAQWSVGDLNFPSIGSIKQGQDVKLLVLVSPVRTHKGVSLEDSLNDPLLASLPFLIVVGETSKQMGDAERVFKRLETIKKRFSRGEPVGLEFAPFPTSLTGHALVNDDPKVIPKIASFLESALIKNAPRIPWVERP